MLFDWAPSILDGTDHELKRYDPHGSRPRRRALAPFAAPRRLVDVSVGGALIACQGGFEWRDSLALLWIQFLPGRPPRAFVCRVDDSGPAAFRRAFEGLAEREEDRLRSVIFGLQRQALRDRRRRRLE